MKKHLVLCSLVLTATQQSASAFFGDPFADLDRMMRKQREAIADIERMAKAHRADASGAQSDYTLQHSLDGDFYTVTVTLSENYGKQAPKVMINSSRDRFNAEVKELEIEAISPVEETKGSKSDADRRSYSSYSYSSTVMVKDGVVFKQGQESARATMENGLLKVVHQLPQDVNEDSYTMSFDQNTRVLVVKFDVREQQQKAAQRTLAYTKPHSSGRTSSVKDQEPEEK